MGDRTVPMWLMHLAFYIFLLLFCCRGSARSAATINLCKIIKETAIRLAHTFKTRSDGWMDGATMHPSSFCPRRRRHSLTHSTTTRRIDKLSFPPLFTGLLHSQLNVKRGSGLCAQPLGPKDVHVHFLCPRFNLPFLMANWVLKRERYLERASLIPSTLWPFSPLHPTGSTALVWTFVFLRSSLSSRRWRLEIWG